MLISYLDSFLFNCFTLSREIFYGNPKLIDLTRRVDDLAKPLPSAAIGKFRGIVKKLKKNIAVGASKKGTVLLDKDYWMEALGMKLVIDGKIIQGHIYTGFLANQDKLLEKWRTGLDEKGVPFQKQYSFETYLNEIYIPQLSLQQREDFKSKVTLVEYYTPRELTALEAHFDHMGKIFTKNPFLNGWVDRQDNNLENMGSYRNFYRTVPPSNTQEAAEKHVMRDQTYIYVQDHQGRVYLQIKKRGITNHTSLSNGHAVLAAGSLKVEKGNIVEIDTFSGHYKPTKEQLAAFLVFLGKSGVDLDRIKVTYVADYSVQPWDIRTLKAGEVRSWLG